MIIVVLPMIVAEEEPYTSEDRLKRKTPIIKMAKSKKSCFILIDHINYRRSIKYRWFSMKFVPHILRQIE